MNQNEFKLIKYSVLGEVLYYEKISSTFFLKKPTNVEIEQLEPLNLLKKEHNGFKPKLYTFCIDVSDACNLKCDYCFNQDKKDKIINSQIAIGYLEKMFNRFPNGEKYIVDMSGKGEPLLALKVILEIVEWCHKKQDEIKKEILPQLVCNGTLLTPPIVDILQKHGILFGISLDGNKEVHDMHRKNVFGEPTFDIIMNNINNIKNREFIGCATTLTKNVFPLLKSIEYLSSIFNTLSYRPVRGLFSFDKKSEKLWEKEYDILSNRLISDMRTGETKLFISLMNGDDFFGKFLCRAFANFRVLTRCDAGISRFAIDLEGKIYLCPSCSSTLSFSSNNIIDAKNIMENINKQESSCQTCNFKTICGGECLIEAVRYGEKNKIMCNFRKHLILLASIIKEKTLLENLQFAIYLQNFALIKEKRNCENTEMANYLNAHKGLSYTEAKQKYDFEKNNF